MPTLQCTYTGGSHTSQEWQQFDQAALAAALEDTTGILHWMMKMGGTMSTLLSRAQSSDPSGGTTSPPQVPARRDKTPEPKSEAEATKNDPEPCGLFPSALLSPTSTPSKIFKDASNFDPEQITTALKTTGQLVKLIGLRGRYLLNQFGKNWNSADAQGLTPEELTYDQDEAFKTGLVQHNARSLQVQMLRDGLFPKGQACSARIQLLRGSFLSTKIENAMAGKEDAMTNWIAQPWTILAVRAWQALYRTAHSQNLTVQGSFLADLIDVLQAAQQPGTSVQELDTRVESLMSGCSLFKTVTEFTQFLRACVRVQMCHTLARRDDATGNAYQKMAKSLSSFAPTTSPMTWRTHSAYSTWRLNFMLPTSIKNVRLLLLLVRQS